jgi:hypothetical protein
VLDPISFKVDFLAVASSVDPVLENLECTSCLGSVIVSILILLEVNYSLATTDTGSTVESFWPLPPVNLGSAPDSTHLETFSFTHSDFRVCRIPEGARGHLLGVIRC